MRKVLLSLACLCFMTGLAVATEVTLLRFDKDKKEVTVKEGEKEATYKITEKTKFTTTDKDGKATEMTYESALKGLTSEKSVGRLKFDITTKEDVITEAKMRSRKKN